MIFFLGNYPASGVNLKTNASGLTVCPIIRVEMMGQTVSPETLVFKI
jgi:hypothetical protein